MINNGMLSECNSTTFKFSSDGSGNATKMALFFGLEDPVLMSGIISFNEAETRLVVGFLGSAVLCSSSTKAGLYGGDVEIFSRFVNASGFISALPTLRLNVFTLMA